MVIQLLVLNDNNSQTDDNKDDLFNIYSSMTLNISLLKLCTAQIYCAPSALTGIEMCLFTVSLDQASLWRCEKLIFGEGALCALPRAAELGSLLESPVCARIEGVDN